MSFTHVIMYAYGVYGLGWGLRLSDTQTTITAWGLYVG